MNNQKIIDKIKLAAELDARKRRDIRFRRVMAFMVHKGFLKTNMEVGKKHLGKIRIKDAIWAGRNVEPRILEVLPAAIARLPRAFIDLSVAPKNIRRVVAALMRKEVVGPSLFEVPYAKMKVWMDLSLSDGRTKPSSEKKVMKTFRMSQATIQQIKLLALKFGGSETEVIERLVALNS